jgi:nucleoside-diphosphate-sugar epimerase
MSRIFVTGANGFIASHLIEYLLGRGDEVIALVRVGSDVRWLKPLLEARRDRLRLAVGDLRDRKSLDDALDDVHYVYHLGAVLMATSEEEFRQANIRGTRNLLEVLSARRPRDFKRFLFASAQAAAGPSQDGQPLDESHALRPVSFYGKSKADAEAVVREFGDRIPSTIVRPVAVYGERERDISGGTFPAVKAGFAPKLGWRSKSASLIYVGDVVRGMIAAAESPGSLGKAYFLADPHPYPMRAIVHAMADAMGKRVRIPMVTPHSVLTFVAVVSEWAHHFTHRRPMLTRDKVRELKQRWWVVTPAAAERDFGWRAEVGLEEGMARAVADWERRKLSAPVAGTDSGLAGSQRATKERHETA